MDENEKMIFTDEGRKLWVAYWFERLARHLLHFKLFSFDEWLKTKGMSRFDLDCGTINSYVEVKGSSNMDQLKLSEDQLDGQIEELNAGFPFDRAFVWIFSYRNRQPRDKNRRQRARLLSRQVKSCKQLTDFLASQTNVAYLIDLRLLYAFRQEVGVSPYSRDKIRLRHIVNINRTDLRKLAEDARSLLSWLGIGSDMTKWVPFKAGRIKSRFVETELDGNKIKFELLPLLPIARRSQLFRQLNGQVMRP